MSTVLVCDRSWGFRANCSWNVQTVEAQSTDSVSGSGNKSKSHHTIRKVLKNEYSEKVTIKMLRWVQFLSFSENVELS
jgi:hypothetical protein